MNNFENYISKQTREKLKEYGITSWVDLIKIHKKQNEEFWNDFSKNIPDTDRKKLESVLYRECHWDNNKYYSTFDVYIEEDGSLIPRPDTENSYFEIIKFEQTITKGNITKHNDDFIEEKTIIDRIDRTFLNQSNNEKNGYLEIKSDISYYDLNRIFAALSRDVNDGKFNNANYIESTRYCQYKLTYANGKIVTYNQWLDGSKDEIYCSISRIIKEKQTNDLCDLEMVEIE